jgi:hypothetical protein
VSGQRRELPGTHAARRTTAFAVLAAALLALSIVVSGCAQDTAQSAAEQNKAKLDAELRHARSLGIPDALLQPVLTQEQAVANGAGGSKYSDQDAASNYALLYTQLVGIEQTAAQTLKQQAQTDLQAFSSALSSRRAEGFSEANAYQARLNQAFQDFGTASTAGDFARVDATARAQTEALNSLDPAYTELQDFKAAIQTVHNAGFSSSGAELEYADDLAIFRDGASAARFARLVDIITGQINQLMADQTEALPYIGAVLLDTFQARIDDLKRFGVRANAYQQQHDADAATLASAKTLAAYLTLGQVINRQTAGMTLDYVRGKAHYDLNQLRQLVAQAQAGNPLVAYEYASYWDGVGIPERDLASAYDVSSFAQVDGEIEIMTTNLRAMLDNLSDPTGPDKPHATDLQLMQQYGIISGRVIIVSLREQTSRIYQNGKLVYWSYVTTGRPEKPSPPGLHYVIDKEYHTEFVSGDPPGSPLWYAPTPINYGLRYADGGYFLHDAWWRYKFGPGSNLPHWDPLAFNGGSHGCVNYPETNMAWVYTFAQVGDPVILY